MAHHYHISWNVNGTPENADEGFRPGPNRHYGVGLPMTIAREDAANFAESRGMERRSSGVYGNVEDHPDGDYIIIDPCDNEVDFDLDPFAYRNPVTGNVERAPKGQPCTVGIIKDAWTLFG